MLAFLHNSILGTVQTSHVMLGNTGYIRDIKNINPYISRIEADSGLRVYRNKFRSLGYPKHVDKDECSALFTNGVSVDFIESIQCFKDGITEKLNEENIFEGLDQELYKELLFNSSLVPLFSSENKDLIKRCIEALENNVEDLAVVLQEHYEILESLHSSNDSERIDTFKGIWNNALELNLGLIDSTLLNTAISILKKYDHILGLTDNQLIVALKNIRSFVYTDKLGISKYLNKSHLGIYIVSRELSEHVNNIRKGEHKYDASVSTASLDDIFSINSGSAPINSIEPVEGISVDQSEMEETYSAGATAGYTSSIAPSTRPGSDYRVERSSKLPTTVGILQGVQKNSAKKCIMPINVPLALVILAAIP